MIENARRPNGVLSWRSSKRSWPSTGKDLTRHSPGRKRNRAIHGTVVYRHPTPALAEDDQVILALAKGPGFQATVQIPTREATMLEPGQELRMKLKHSLVSDEVSGRLEEIRPVPGYRDRSDIS